VRRSNRVILEGAIKEDPEVRYTRTGKQIIVFTLALPSARFEAEGSAFVDEVVLRVVWPSGSVGPRGCGTIKVGDTIHLEGGLTQRVWKTDEGIPRREIQVIARHVTVLGDEEA